MSPPPKEVELLALGLATIGYATAWAYYSLAWAKAKPSLSRFASVLAWFSLGLQALSLGFRTARAGHLPIYNAFEFTSVFAASIILTHLVFEAVSRRRELGVVTIPVALILLGYAWSLSKEVEPLIPIFRSLWLKVHVLTAFVAYAAFAVTFGASCLYLGRKPQGSPRAHELDRLAYQAAALGFPFMTLCIISGAIWAEYVWGRFWSWDPKETWSLITWLLFAAYLHTRYHRGWRERRAAILAVAGFVAVIITYLGVDLIMARQHNFLFWRSP
jgi:ABC-type transport system involved in cytochrome c biogenesis permease subunit